MLFSPFRIYHRWLPAQDVKQANTQTKQSKHDREKSANRNREGRSVIYRDFIKYAAHNTYLRRGWASFLQFKLFACTQKNDLYWMSSQKKNQQQQQQRQRNKKLLCSIFYCLIPLLFFFESIFHPINPSFSTFNCLVFKCNFCAALNIANTRSKVSLLKIIFNKSEKQGTATIGEESQTQRVLTKKKTHQN